MPGWREAMPGWLVSPTVRGQPNLTGQKKFPTAFEASRPLDLAGLGGTATIQPDDLVLTLAVLSSREPPSKILLPPSLLVRRRLARAGLVFAAHRRGIRMEIERTAVSVPEALEVPAMEQPLALEQYDFGTSDRMRVVSHLESRSRRPPEPDLRGRRYYWIDGLGVAAGHPERDFFDSHADQCFFELIDNVHRWASSTRAVAIVSATAGGGEQSHNRLQVVVADDGVGIVASARAKAAAMAASGTQLKCVSNGDKADSEIAVDVINDLLRAVYRDRAVVGARGGHGLHTINGHVSRWDGTMNVISSFAPDRAIHVGRRGRAGEWSTKKFTVEGLRGTMAHLTLDAVRQEASRSSEVRHREPAAV